MKSVYSRALDDYLRAKRAPIPHRDERAREPGAITGETRRGTSKAFRGETAQTPQSVERTLLARDWFAFFLNHDRRVLRLTQRRCVEEADTCTVPTSTPCQYELGRNAPHPWPVAVVL